MKSKERKMMNMNRNNKLLISVLSFSLLATLMSVEAKNVVRDEVNLNVTTTHENAIGRVDVGRHNVLIGSDAAVSYSPTYVQCGTDSNGKNLLRFATAVKGDISKLTYTLNYEGLQAPLTKEVTSVYKGIQSGGSIVYYNGSEVTTTPSDYYWACVTVRFTSNDKDSLELTGQLTINDSTVIDGKTATLAAVKEGAPGLSVSDEIVSGKLQGEAITLPTYSAVSASGINLTDKVVVKDLTDENAEISADYTTLTSNVYGTHTIEYSVTDELTGKTVTTQREIDVYRKLYSGHDGKWEVENQLSYNQIATTSNAGFGTSRLNYAPSSYYYVESLVHMPSGHHGGHQVGMSNYRENNNSSFLTFAIDLGDYNWKVKDFLSDGQWNLEGEVDNWRLGEYFLKDVPTSEETTFKFGMLRKGKEFYMFINDNYVTMVTDKDYSNVPTYPGFFTHAGSSGTKFANINYISGEEAVNNKFNSLIGNGESLFTNYIARGVSWAFDSQNIDNRNYTVNAKTEEKGLNFSFTNASTHHNGGMVSLYQYFDGDFTFEWDYIPTSEWNTNNDCKMWLEARPLGYGDEIWWIGTKFRQNDAEQMIKRIKTEVTGENWTKNVILNPRAGMHYKVARRVDTAAGKCYFDLVITSLVDSSKVVQQLNVPYSGTCWNDKLILIWHNTNQAGEFSNVTWSTN